MLSADDIRDRIDKQKQNDWQRTLQAAALASIMPNKAALGFGVGSLLFNIMNKAKGDGTHKPKTPVVTGEEQFQQMVMPKPTGIMDMMAGTGNQNAAFALNSQNPLNQTPSTQNGVPAPKVTPNGVQFGIGKGLFNTMQPQNFGNYVKENTGNQLNLGGAWQMQKPNYILGAMDENGKKPWEVQ